MTPDVSTLLSEIDATATPSRDFEDALLRTLLTELDARRVPPRKTGLQRSRSRVRWPVAVVTDLPRTPVLRKLRQRPGRIALGAAVLAGTVAAALFVTAPWSGTAGFLERAQAALTPPAGSILHFKLVETWTSKDFRCTLTRDPLEVWIDQTPPHRYRALLPGTPNPPPASETPRDFICREAKTTTEIGGQTQPAERGLVFMPPKILRRSMFAMAFFPSDPAGDLRRAIREGRAHDEGRTKLDGRTVERIRIDPPPPGCPVSFCPGERGLSDIYVDPKTFALVQEEVRPLVWGPPLKHPVHVDIVVRYPTFEYLPRTTSNLALTNIRARHPDATVQCTPTWLERC